MGMHPLFNDALHLKAFNLTYSKMCHLLVPKHSDMDVQLMQSFGEAMWSYGASEVQPKGHCSPGGFSVADYKIHLQNNVCVPLGTLVNPTH